MTRDYLIYRGPLADPVPQRTAVPTPQQIAAHEAQCRLLEGAIVVRVQPISEGACKSQS